MDLQFGIFVGVDRHDESKLESQCFCIGFQSITSSDAVTTLVITQSAALKQGGALAQFQKTDLAVFLTNCACCATYQRIPLQRRTTARQYTDNR